MKQSNTIIDALPANLSHYHLRLSVFNRKPATNSIEKQLASSPRGHHCDIHARIWSDFILARIVIEFF